MKTAKFSLPVLGVDLLANEYSIPPGRVRAASNVDFRRDGSFYRRDGYELAVPGAGFHGLKATSRGCFVARSGYLYALDTDTYAPSMVSPLGSNAPVDITEHNGDVYFISRTAFVWLPSDSNDFRDVGVRWPATLPAMESTAEGALVPGDYAVAISRVDDRGEESNTAFLGTLRSEGGIRLTGLTADFLGSIRVYLTAPGGDVLYLSEEFGGTFTSFLVTRPPDGATRTSQHLKPMPRGDFVRGHAGRLYVAVGDTLYFSDVLRPRLYDPRHNYIKFTGRIRFVESVVGGLYVGDDRGAWFLPGNDPTEMAMRRANPSRPVARSSLLIEASNLPKEFSQVDQDVAVWLAEDGYMLGRPDGNVASLTPDRIRVAAELEGRSVYVVREGVKQIITLVAASTASGFGVAHQTTLQ
jgi:hypothetical protein